MRSSIFLSYASEQSEAATHIELSLKGDGYSVFRDRTSLPPGESFDARILAAIEESDLFIFLISRESISHGRYTLTELKFAEQKWGHPAGHVLPVLVEPVPKEAIPIFLRAVTILQPQGNVTAEVAAEGCCYAYPRRRRVDGAARLSRSSRARAPGGETREGERIESRVWRLYQRVETPRASQCHRPWVQ